MKTTPFQLANIPQDMKSSPQWVGFRIMGEDKTPYVADAPHRKASSTDQNTWRTFETAVAGLRTGVFHAIAYALNGDFIGVDLDDCFDGDRLKDYAAEIVKRCSSYAEKSFSGTGIHILMKGVIDKGHNRKEPIEFEMYGRARFWICTGNRLPDTPKDIQSNPDAVQWIIDTYVIETIKTTETINAISASSLPISMVSMAFSLPELIEKTLPKRPRERNRKILDFARGLRFNMNMDGCDHKKLKPLVRQWYDAALPVIQTKDFDTTWGDFIHAWSRARHPLGADLIAVAWEKSKTDSLPIVAGEYDSEPVKRLVGLCAALGSFSPDGNFFLSTYAAGRLLDKTPKEVHRSLMMLREDGIIELKEAGTHGISGGRASRYRWTGAAQNE